MKICCNILCTLVLACQSHAERHIQSQVVALSATASDAVLPITVNYTVEGPPETSHWGAVIGTGFLINTSGDFITAGHVIDSLNVYTVSPNVTSANLAARIRNRAGGGGERQFRIVDRDDDHDLVLCHVPGVNAVTPPKSNMPKNIEPDAVMPFASLAISTAEPKSGQFVLVSGFPLGSWSSTVCVRANPRLISADVSQPRRQG
jgi:S1-C subfamily serine protease